MATHHGKAGTVKLGANTVAEIQNFSFTQQLSTADDTAMGDAAETHLAGIESWTGQVECSWDETDTNGQVALTIGASVTLNMYPEGAGSGAKYYTGTATVTELQVLTPRNDVVKATFSFKGNGALTIATV